MASASWLNECKYNPIEPLMSSKNEVMQYFVKRDLLGEGVRELNFVWGLPEVSKILKRQLPNGSWKYRGAKKSEYPPYRYYLIETWKQFRFLVEQYGMDRSHDSIRRAAEFIFSCQSEEGDIRGFIGNQYATYYTGAIVALLNKAGYQDDPRIMRVMRWLLSMRQDDGVTVPVLTRGYNWREITKMTTGKKKIVEPDKTKPFSHGFTGMVLRAFATHERYRKSEEAWHAALLLADRFFEKDSYSSYRSPSHWVRFQFPFWWNNLLSALDTVLSIGIPKDNAKVVRAIRWFKDNQEEDGLWKVSYSGIHKSSDSKRSNEMRNWISLNICKVLKRYYGG